MKCVAHYKNLSDLKFVSPFCVAAVRTERKMKMGTTEVDLFGPFASANFLVIANFDSFGVCEFQVVIPVKCRTRQQ